ncbi:MAG: MFS transporter [SAR202 cluster bacterium]|nr:MFS transporter [SAR202 cluster bacterium]
MKIIRLTHNNPWLVMSGVWIQAVTISVMGSSLGIMLPSITQDLNISPVQAGVLGSAFFLGSASTSLPASVWMSKYSPKTVTTIALLLAALFMMLQGWSPTFMFLLLGRFLFQVTMVTRMVGEAIVIQQWFSTTKIALVVSITVGIFSSGQLIGIATMTFLMDSLGGWRNVYYVFGVLMIITSVYWILVGRDNISTKDQDRLDDGSPLQILRKRKILWVIAVAPSGAAAAFASVITFWPTYALNSLPLSLEEIGLLLTLFPFGGMIAAFVGGPLSDKIRQRKILIWGPGVLLPIIYLFLFTSDSILIVGILLFAAGWNAMIWVPIIRTIQYDLGLKPRETAVSLGLFMTMMPIGGALGPPIVGAIEEIYGSLQYGLITISFLPLTLLVGGLFIPETSPLRKNTSRD